tara:strand:+ start:135 stop:455 length:321 start_codon:yes stop_codon:yes gene_type:complete
MAFKMKGWSPFNQEGPVSRKASSNMIETRNDLEEEISYIQEDLDEDANNKELLSKKKKLQMELDIIQKKIEAKSGGATGVKPGYTDGERDKSKDKYYGKKGPLGVG